MEVDVVMKKPQNRCIAVCKEQATGLQIKRKMTMELEKRIRRRSSVATHKQQAIC